MKKFLITVLIVILVFGSVGALCYFFAPDEPTNQPSQDTNSDTNVDTDTDIDVPAITDFAVETVEDLTLALASSNTGARIIVSETLELTEPINVGNKEVVFFFTEGYDKPITVLLNEGKVSILSGYFKGIDIGGKGTVILENVMSHATVEDDSGLALLDGADITLKTSGTVSLVGAKGGDGIEVPYGTKLLITGENLVAVGNNGLEYAGLTGYDTTDDTTYLNKRGSGIGNAVENIGSITIKDMNSLTVKGYGNKAFGIGGGDKSVITIENTLIEYARGGFPQKNFIMGNTYGKTEAEGGCAIGVGCGNDGDFDTGTVNLKNVTIKKAEGGSKSAAIGALYWTGVDISIVDCNFENIVGGNSSAGIGGSRVHKNNSQDQTVHIYIENSKINVTGGEFGAGIGTGYDTYCQKPFGNNTIEIVGEKTSINATGGKNAAGIGSGHHTAGLSGFIGFECSITAKAGELYVYEDNYTLPQDIGYGVCNPNNELADIDLVFDIQGIIVTMPVAQERAAETA